MTNGSITINGIDDRGLVTILEVKERNEGKITFNPQQMQAPGSREPTKTGIQQRDY
jgi:hypothetical protein